MTDCKARPVPTPSATCEEKTRAPVYGIDRAVKMRILDPLVKVWSASVMKTHFATLGFFLSPFTLPFAGAMPAPKPVYHVLARSAKGLQLRQALLPSPEGGRAITYQVLSKDGQVASATEVSNTLFDVTNASDPHAEKISASVCHERVRDIAATIRRQKLRGATANEGACENDRTKTVTAIANTAHGKCVGQGPLAVPRCNR